VFSAALVTSLLLAVPHGWHELRTSPTLQAGCDPVTLLVVGSQPPVLGREGWRRPGRGQVLVFVEEDHVNKPVGPLKRQLSNMVTNITANAPKKMHLWSSVMLSLVALRL